MSTEKKLRPCVFRPRGVTCDEAGNKCWSCGWNPKIEKERKEKLYGYRSKEKEANAS